MEQLRALAYSEEIAEAIGDELKRGHIVGVLDSEVDDAIVVFDMQDDKLVVTIVDKVFKVPHGWTASGHEATPELEEDEANV